MRVRLCGGEGRAARVERDLIPDDRPTLAVVAIEATRRELLMTTKRGR